MMKDVFKIIIQTFIKKHWNPTIQVEYDTKYPRVFLSCFLFDPIIQGNLINSLVDYFELFEDEAMNQYNHAVQVCLDKVGFVFTNYYFDQRNPKIGEIATKDLRVMFSDYDICHNQRICDLFVSELFQFLNYDK